MQGDVSGRARDELRPALGEDRGERPVWALDAAGQAGDFDGDHDILLAMHAPPWVAILPQPEKA